MAADPTQFKLRHEDPDAFVLICLVCWEPFADDNSHAEIRINDPHPRLDHIINAATDHQHGKEPEL